MYFSSTRISPNRRALGDSSPFTAVVCAALAAGTAAGPPCERRGGFGPRLKWLTTLGSWLKWLTVSSRGERDASRVPDGPVPLTLYEPSRFSRGSRRTRRGHDPISGQFLARRPGGRRR